MNQLGQTCLKTRRPEGDELLEISLQETFLLLLASLEISQISVHIIVFLFTNTVLKNPQPDEKVLQLQQEVKSLRKDLHEAIGTRDLFNVSKGCLHQSKVFESFHLF